MSEHKWVFLGDSLTYGYGVQRRQTWVSLCGEQSGLEMINAGVTGDTTGGMLARFQTEVLPHRPTHLFLMGGANDIFLSGEIAGARANLGAIIYQAMCRGITPVVGLPSPIHPMVVESPWGQMFDFTQASAQMCELCEWLRHFAGSFGISVVDFRNVFGTPPEAQYYVDGLHPNPLGHQRIAQWFLAKAFSDKPAGPVV